MIILEGGGKTKDDQKDSEDKEQPTPERIYDLVTGGWRANILKTAIQLDVFTTIANGPRTVEAIAAAENWAIRPTRLLLDGLCPMGFLTKKGGEYLLTPISEAFLVSSSETYGGEYVLATLANDAWQQLVEAVKTGRHQTPDLFEVWEQDAAMESMRGSRIAQGLEMWRAVGIDPDTKQTIRVLDLASGCSMKSFVLAQRNPDASITCVDWPGVLQVAKRLAEKWDILKQVSCNAGDATTMDYGDSLFDAVLLGQITYYWGPNQNKSVLKKVHRALTPGGLVVIHAPIVDEERCISNYLTFAVVIFLFNKEAGFYTFPEYKAFLEEADFSEVTKHSEWLISAKK